MKNEQNLNEAYQGLSEMIAVNPQAFYDRYVSVSTVRGEEGQALELTIRSTPRSQGDEYAARAGEVIEHPITLRIDTLTQSASFQHRDLSSETLETTATEAIQVFAEAMLAAIEEQSR